MRAKAHLPIVAATAVLLSGCLSQAVRNEVDKQESDVAVAISAPPVTAKRAEIQSSDRLYIPVRRVKAADARSSWLTGHPLAVDLDTPVPLTTVMRVFSDRGVNIVSDLPLDGYTWSGRINTADLETALRMVLGGVGLDYEIDDERKLVTIRPVRSRTWTLNLGNRNTTYSSGGSNAVALSESDTDVTGSASGGAGGGMNSISRNGGGQNSEEGQLGARINSKDNFWESLKTELDSRLQVRFPSQSSRGAWGPTAAAGAPGAAPAAPTGTSNSSGSERTWIGTYSLNPETGSVTVSAPNWILTDVDKYMVQVQAMYNAEITFQGELIMVSRTRNDSEGLDVSAFASFAKGKYGAVIQNNALGGVTLSFPGGANNLANVSATAQTVGGALIGITSPTDSLQLFNAWLSEVGRVSVIQRPIVTTTSGVPGEFSKKSPVYFNLVSQETATGGVSGAVSATRNTLQSKSFGTQLTINPRYDFNTGLIRAQIALNHVLPNGSQVINQTISSGDSFQTVSTTIPLDSKLAYSGEALLRDGDLVVIGGQTEESRSLNENGLPGKRGAISGLLGTKNVSKEYGTYYFALRVKIKAR
ncbi:hypothetical protein LMG31884_46210 (plasmid) [Xanthomonas hydrangeae]|uniref:hypothetical protein n=2 Tax=Xanthomonas TaxID=338 RepID=UPI001AF19C19|nr:hypothetical protein LMG31884_46210 [Xanthomonas hydrangeae]CAD7740076.1 hypothetical protein LMG31884_46210 [Xanthomonas hydrangeae]